MKGKGIEHYARNSDRRGVVANQQEGIGVQASPEIFKGMYDNAKLKLKESLKEIDNLKEKLAELNALLRSERRKADHSLEINKRLKREIDDICFDEDELLESLAALKQLSLSKDREIETLVAQINLLIQIETFKNQDPSSSTERLIRFMR
mmetsp:Transcript_19684/g.29209  ORF Transcript_19684/g.29209 Transcript_19684/m.29209 type:complete len:150 (-) Transcript_19684:328-777(-)|eukprot:CAMPEP_0194216426 /NCGR_PEP_ID=MMETSP0156-20130528/18952_1 /TAXON_ID=33649 /ORGANISM="Thalassionema nitzschioides, Strain L26-B" /LENGTH=149 /DNA_ID=CAMNT_0038945191 /DNA_START=82 /DNA_END=531 /DNA_ORIENTATION=+